MNNKHVMQQALKALNDSVYLVSEYYNEAVDLYYNQPAQQINLAALNTDVEAHKAAIAALIGAIAQPVEPADHIHSCSYFCDKPACIKAQRKELVQQNAELILLLEGCKKKTPQVMPAKEALLDLAHRKAWRYKKSSDPAHSDTYTFNEACMLDFVSSLELRLLPDELSDYMTRNHPNARGSNLTAKVIDALESMDPAPRQPVEPAEAPLTPAGWMLVPIEPTSQMLESSSIASDYEVSQSRAKVVYAAMINAIAPPVEGKK